jgi:hypothetical protein
MAGSIVNRRYKKGGHGALKRSDSELVGIRSLHVIGFYYQSFKDYLSI